MNVFIKKTQNFQYDVIMDEENFDFRNTDCNKDSQKRGEFYVSILLFLSTVKILFLEYCNIENCSNAVVFLYPV